MVNAFFTDNFTRAVKKVKDAAIKERLKRQIAEILDRPDIGKPLRFEKKGERCVYVPPFRIIYALGGILFTFWILTNGTEFIVENERP